MLCTSVFNTAMYVYLLLSEMEEKLPLLFELLLQCSGEESKWLLAVMGTKSVQGKGGQKGIEQLVTVGYT